MATYYPPPAFHFRVEFLLDGASDEDTRFQEVSGLGAELQTEELVEGGENRFAHQFPTGARHGNLVLKRGLLTSSGVVGWIRDAIENMDFTPVDVVVTLLSENHDPLAGWSFTNAYPVKWTIGNLNATDNNVLVETLELAYQCQKSEEAGG
jgi:phage tail-like protein